MTERITAQQFHQNQGVEDWRVLSSGACAHFRTGSFATGLALLNAVGELAEAANHHPDVDLRYGSVTVRLWTHEVDGLSDRDVKLAREISRAARELNIGSDPGRVQDVQVSVDTPVDPKVLAFWRAVLSYRQRDDDLLDPDGRGPCFRFRQPGSPRTERDRIRVGVSVPHDRAAERVAAALDAGGRVVNESCAPASWTLADPEGDEVDIATWLERDE